MHSIGHNDVAIRWNNELVKLSKDVYGIDHKNTKMSIRFGVFTCSDDSDRKIDYLGNYKDYLFDDKEKAYYHMCID